jgi:hypothetical protein
MATVKKIKKAAAGAVCGPGRGGGSCTWSKGEKPYRTPLKEKIANIRGEMQAKKEERESAKSLKKGPSVGYERDFPGDKSPGGFGARDKEGEKGTRWTKDSQGKTVRANKGSMKKGGKIAKKAKVGTKLKKSK